MGWDEEDRERRRPPDERAFRFGDIERRVRVMERSLEELKPSLLAYRLTEIEADIRELKEAFTGLRKTLLGFALTIAGSAVVFAFTVLTATGKI